MDVTVARGQAAFFAYHSALEELKLVEPPETVSASSFGNIYGSIHKKSFVSGNKFRIRKIGFGILAFVSCQIERQSQLRAIWDEIAAGYSARHYEHHDVPARHSKPWRQCLLVTAATEKEILEALHLRPSVDELILVIVKNDLTEREREQIPDDIKIIFAQDTNDAYFALLRACHSGLLSGFEFVGLCLHYPFAGLEPQNWPRHSLSDPSKWDLKILCGSKSNVRSIMSVFESDSTIAMVESPLMSLFRGSFADRLEISLEQMNSLPRSAWFRVKSLEAVLPSVLAGFECERIQSDFQPHWPTLLEQSLSTAGFITTARLWADLRDGEPANAASYRIFRPLMCPEGKKVCLFVCFAPNGELRQHALHFMRELRRQGYLVFALAANDRSDLETLDPGTDICDGLAARENIGYDFALWATALLHDPRLFAAHELLLVNDSLVGPLLPLDGLFKNIEKTETDIVGLVDSYQHNYHCQSFFFLLRSTAITSGIFMNFIKSINSFADKDEVIREYELKFYSTMVAGGLSFNVQFPTARLGKGKNPTVQYWRELLKLGFPFVKLQVVQKNPLMDDLSDMTETLSRHADDAHIISSFIGLRDDHNMR
ncbi:rhamnan synthesis F family protein [Aminobacter anthyllidis]|uniref:rhamnan synthesis F family protein n=1 Tax=Aminobacter anthyllidis TaxID=1035067 RepID=UPI002454EE20|nr:rhamnan synthesis F family protein [Aminobacter anthyllidis]MDH4984417.1 rhamnan synthesis F family protein [Aminobacter anthyllidis]